MTLGLGLVALGFFVLIFAAAGLLVEIFFLLNLQETLRRVSPENRRMTPGLVWLCIIPGFGMAWFIYTVIKISDSVRAEFRGRGWPLAGDFGYGVGLAAGIINIAGLIWEWVPGHIVALGLLFSVGYLVCWIMYWVRIARIKNQLGPVAYDGPVVSPYTGYGPGAGPTAGPGGSAGADGQDRQWGPDWQQGSGLAGESEEQGGEQAEPDAQPTKCPLCNTAVMPTDRFCRGCGSPLA